MTTFKLEKNKVYKVYFPYRMLARKFPRNYLLICPKRNFNFTLFDNFKQLECHFICCFNGDVVYNSQTSIVRGVWLSETPFKQSDFDDIKKAMYDFKKYVYNRKLNELVLKDDTKKHNENS